MTELPTAMRWLAACRGLLGGAILNGVSSAAPTPLDTFVGPMLGLPAWNVKQGHSSFLTFDFGEPRLEVSEWHSEKRGLRRLARVRGQWHLWIYCCHWRALQGGTQLAWSEDADELIERAAAMLNGQKLLAVRVDPNQGRSTFEFDLGGAVETWPFGDDPSEEQWTVLTAGEAFAFRADGFYSRGPSDTPPDRVQWLPLS